MRAVIQRVTNASVTVDQAVVGSIGSGLMVLVAVAEADSESAVDKLADKLASLRIFEDEAGKLNRSIGDTGGEILVVSQFTLYGDVSKGNRPSFIQAAEPEKARAYYDRLVARLIEKGIRVATGTFRAHMQVSLVNDGPVTIIMDA